jgi:hypothetical protein
MKLFVQNTSQSQTEYSIQITTSVHFFLHTFDFIVNVLMKNIHKF